MGLKGSKNNLYDDFLIEKREKSLSQNKFQRNFDSGLGGESHQINYKKRETDVYFQTDVEEY